MSDLRGQKLLVSVDFGTGAVTTATYTDGPPPTKRCGLVPGNNSLVAEMGGCGMLMENLRQWIDKCGG